jgi:hypothetical protein
MLRPGRSSAAFPLLALVCAAVTGGACESAPDDSAGGHASGRHVTLGLVDAGLGRVDGSAEAGCALGTLPLLIKPQSDAPDAPPYKLYVPATTDGHPSVFLIDTGSPITFLHETPADGGSAGVSLVPDAGSAALGCDTLDLPGAAVATDPPYGDLRVAGTLGDEHLLAQPVHLDLAAGQVVWHAPAVAFAGAATWPSAPFDRPGGYVRIHDVAFDGVPVQMFVDTGSADSVWLGQQGQPGDVEVDGEDARGQTFKMYLGTVAVSIGSYEETVPVFRVPTFPYLQESVAALDGQLNGLFGLSAFPRGIVFDTDANVVRIAP